MTKRKVNFKKITWDTFECTTADNTKIGGLNYFDIMYHGWVFIPNRSVLWYAPETIDALNAKLKELNTK